MADRFWVGGTATWDGTAGTKWATTSGGGGGAAAPTSADDVYINGASGAVTISLAAGAVCKTLDFTGFTGTFGSTSSGPTVSIFGGLVVVSGFTMRTGHGFIMSATTDNGGSGWPVTTNGVTMCPLTFSGSGGKWTLQDNLTCGAITQSNGTLDTNSKTVTSSGVWTQSGSPTTTMGSSQISATTLTWASTGTFTANTATITLTSTAATVTVASGGRDANGASLVMTLTATSAATFAGGTWANVTRTDVTTGSTAMSGDLTVTNTLTLTGSSASSRHLVQTNVLGTQRTITAATVSLTNVDFMDIAAAGAASPFTGTRLGDCLGNSNITFDTPRTLYAVASGNFSSTAMWSLGSGGTAGEPTPMPQDDVILDGGSAAGTYTNDLLRPCRNLNCTGFTRTLANTSTTISFYGSLTFVSGMTVSLGNPNVYFRGRGSHTLTNGGKSWSFSGGNRDVTFSAPDGSYTLGDAFIASSTVNILFDAGTFNSANYPITARYIGAVNPTAACTLNFGTSTITSITTTAFGFSGSTLTLDADEATFVCDTASLNSRTFTGGGFNYGTITYTVANSTGTLVLTGANTIGTLNVGSGRQVTFPANTITTVGNLNIDGSKRGGFYMPSNSTYASTNAAARIPAGDFTLDVKLAMDTWIGGPDSQHVGVLPAAPNRSWVFTTRGGINARPLLQTTFDGTNMTVFQASANPPVVNQEPLWMRTTFDSDNGAGGRTVRFYTSTDGTTWTQLGTAQTAAGTGAVFNSAAPLIVNITAAASAYYRVRLYNSDLGDASGTAALDIDFDAKFLQNSFVESVSGDAVTFSGPSTVMTGDGRVMLRSATGGQSATLLVSGGVDQHSGVDLQDITFNENDAHLGAQALVGSNVRGNVRSPRYSGMLV